MLGMYNKRKDGDHLHSIIDQSFLFIQNMIGKFIHTFYIYLYFLYLCSSFVGNSEVNVVEL